MDIGEIRELSRQRIEAQPLIDERYKLAHDIEKVIDPLRDLFTTERWGTENRHPVLVNLDKPSDDQDGRKVRLVADIFRYGYDQMLTIHFRNEPIKRGQHEYSDHLGMVEISTLGRSAWNVPIASKSEEIKFALSNEDLKELHSTVMAIGEAASDPELNPRLASTMGDVMNQVMLEQTSMPNLYRQSRTTVN